MPTEARDVHEFGILVEQQGQRGGVAVVPRLREQRRDLFRRPLGGGGEFLARPAAVELHELGAMTVQDVGGHDALGPAFRQHHDHESAGANIVDVMRQVLELFEVEGTNQRALKLREEAMVGARRIETLEILLIVQDVDVLPDESGAEQRVDGRLGLDVVADGADHAIGGVRDEASSVSARCFHRHGPPQRETSFAAAVRAREERVVRNRRGIFIRPVTAAVKGFACRVSSAGPSARTVRTSQRALDRRPSS